jgi:hypothetical protein
MPAFDGLRLKDLGTGTPTQPGSGEQNPEQSVAGAQAQTARYAGLQNRQLMSKGKIPSLQSSASPKTGGEQSQKRNQKAIHRGNKIISEACRLCIFQCG